MADKEAKSELPKILRRLELIKSLIFLEEEEEISDQVLKLQQFNLTEDIKNIIELLGQKLYSKSATAIEGFISKHHQINIYADPEVEGLKLEVKSLEKILHALSNEKAELEKVIYEFEVRHNHELGDVILKILKFRREQAKGTSKEKEATEDYTNYDQEFQSFKNKDIFQLNEEERKALKSKYRKATKLCHPDVVSEEQKEAANEIFSALSVAYEKNDLKRISEILEQLEKGEIFIAKSDSINKKQILKAELEKLQLRITELKKEIDSIKTSATYKTINEIVDWNKYFETVLQELMDQLKSLQSEGQ